MKIGAAHMDADSYFDPSKGSRYSAYMAPTARIIVEGSTFLLSTRRIDPNLFRSVNLTSAACSVIEIAHKEKWMHSHWCSFDPTENAGQWLIIGRKIDHKKFEKNRTINSPQCFKIKQKLVI